MKTTRPSSRGPGEVAQWLNTLNIFLFNIYKLVLSLTLDIIERSDEMTK